MTVRKRSTTASPVNLLISLIIFSFFTLFTYSLWKRPSVNAGGLFPCLRAFFQGGRCPPWIRFRFRRNRKRYPPRPCTAGAAAPPRREQRNKSPAELDFYGDFLCGALRCACPACFAEGKMRQETAPKGREKGTPSACLFLLLFSLTLFLLLFFSFSLLCLISRRKARASGGHFRRWRS